ncbi:MAG: hypothetical protein IKP91_07440 [Bacteroidaceae bacterium]|nr:hypothetical protein [Bacteroidaceae bacterium]
MKKIFLSLILSLQGLFLAAQTVSINLDEQNIADVLTPDVQLATTEIVLSGHMTSADYAFVNACPKLTKLDMTDVVIDSIPQFCLSNATSLADLYLPKKQTVFNFYAVKNTLTNSVTAHITGLFPDLDVPTTGDRLAATDVMFTVEKDNKRYYESEEGFIYSANLDTLYRFAQIRSDWYTEAYAVAIRPYAFAWLKLDTGVELEFDPALKLICQHAFEGVRWLPYDLNYRYHNYANFVVILHNNRRIGFPQLEGPVAWNTDEYRAINGSLVFYVEGWYKDYLHNSCLWAGTDLMDVDTHLFFDPSCYPAEKYYDKDGNLLQYIRPHIVSSEWYIGTLNTENVTFSQTSEGSNSPVTTDMDVEYGAYYNYVYSWTLVEREHPNSTNYCAVEYRDTILSPIPEGDDLTYEIEIYDDEGNLLYSNKRRGSKGSTDHLSGTLTNVPQSEQGELKSRSSVLRYGTSPWKSQRISFGVTGIRPLDAAPASNTLYDLQGLPANESQKGIFIRNGKKVLVK